MSKQKNLTLTNSIPIIKEYIDNSILADKKYTEINTHTVVLEPYKPKYKKIIYGTPFIFSLGVPTGIGDTYAIILNGLGAEPNLGASTIIISPPTGYVLNGLDDIDFSSKSVADFIFVVVSSTVIKVYCHTI